MAFGVGIALGHQGVALAWVLLAAAICAALHLWNTRSQLKKTAEDAWGKASGRGPLGGGAMIYFALVGMMSLIAGAGHLLGRWFS
ncbi:MAG: hypothetical protein U1C74_07670 [Phenylobacterium sp.]|nr:hypothetical protein [Phenylobacterium sp.]